MSFNFCLLVDAFSPLFHSRSCLWDGWEVNHPELKRVFQYCFRDMIPKSKSNGPLSPVVPMSERAFFSFSCLTPLLTLIVLECSLCFLAALFSFTRFLLLKTSPLLLWSIFIWIFTYYVILLKQFYEFSTVLFILSPSTLMIIILKPSLISVLQYRKYLRITTTWHSCGVVT